MHGNARSSPLGRLGMVLRVIEEGEPVAQVARRCGPVSTVRVQVGAPLPGGRRGRFGGSVVSAALFPHAHQPGGGGTGVAGGAGPVVGVYGGAGADDQSYPPPPRSVASVGMRLSDRRAAQNPPSTPLQPWRQTTNLQTVTNLLAMYSVRRILVALTATGPPHGSGPSAERGIQPRHPPGCDLSPELCRRCVTPPG